MKLLTGLTKFGHIRVHVSSAHCGRTALPDPHVSGRLHSADQDLRGPTGGHLPVPPSRRVSVRRRRHAPPPPRATDVGGDQILDEAAVVSSFPSLGNYHRLPYHSNATSGSGPRQRTVYRLRVVHLCLVAALRQVFAGYEHPPGFIIGPAPAGLHIRCQIQKIGNPEMHFSRDQLIGSAFIAFGITLFVCFFYVAIVSKLLPPYENRFLAAIQNDWYYCLLVPLTLPVIIVAVYLHWLSMKMFKHA